MSTAISTRRTLESAAARRGAPRSGPARKRRGSQACSPIQEVIRSAAATATGPAPTATVSSPACCAISAPGPAKVAVAHVQDEIFGFCSFGPTRDAAPPDIAEIYSLNVRPDRWRRGAGRMLCEHAFQQAALRGHAAITLWVLKPNER